MRQTPKVRHHIRRLRGGTLARVWILVEGETDETVIPGAARILGHDLFAEGVACFEFTALGIEPYIVLPTLWESIGSLLQT
jgi:predicted ATP-dependent endonuclease of OLD family